MVSIQAVEETGIRENMRMVLGRAHRVGEGRALRPGADQPRREKPHLTAQSQAH